MGKAWVWLRCTIWSELGDIEQTWRQRGAAGVIVENLQTETISADPFVLLGAYGGKGPLGVALDIDGGRSAAVGVREATTVSYLNDLGAFLVFGTDSLTVRDQASVAYALLHTEEVSIELATWKLVNAANRPQPRGSVVVIGYDGDRAWLLDEIGERDLAVHAQDVPTGDLRSIGDALIIV